MYLMWLHCGHFTSPISDGFTLESLFSSCPLMLESVKALGMFRDTGSCAAWDDFKLPVTREKKGNVFKPVSP